MMRKGAPRCAGSTPAHGEGIVARLLCIGEILVEMVAERIDQSRLEPGHWIGPFPSGAP